MLINYSVTNWRSIKKTVDFSMIATREKQHGERLSHVKKFNLKLLPTAAIYGGNASGKSNLVESISFAQNFILFLRAPDASTATRPYRLDNESESLPTKFAFSILIDELIYDYSFAVNQSEVISEELTVINSSSSTILFSRQGQNFDLSPSLTTADQDTQFISYISKGTLKNVLFLTQAAYQGVNKLKPVWNWFRNCLHVLSPESQFASRHQLTAENKILGSACSHYLQALDTGIDHLERKEVDLSNILDKDDTRKFAEFLKDGQSITLPGRRSRERYVIAKENGGIKAYRLFAAHKTSSNEFKLFEFDDESDGTIRLIDIIPAIYDITQKESKSVFIIDELDRSLHTNLTRALIKSFLYHCDTNNRAQLIFTTHDVQLMDQDLFRRDELWITERRVGESDLYSFAEYKEVRKDKQLRKTYIQGRLGGVPYIPQIPNGRIYEEI
ncbi:MAG: ATP-binding protein [Sutterellaceae bacterium]|nr:ATP-binding protein [Sutterellaceae bacterium]